MTVEPLAPAMGGGATVAVKDADRTEEVPLRGGRPVEVQRDQDQLHVIWEYDLRGRAVRVAWTYGILGKALTVSARCDEPLVSRFSLGDVGLVPLRRTFPVPYLPGHIVYLPGRREQGHLVLTAGTPHAGRNLVTWKRSEGDK